MVSFHLLTPVTDEEVVRLILNLSSVCYGQRQLYIKLEALAQDYCFTLHDKCSTLLGYPFTFIMASCKNNLLQVRQ